MKRSNWTVVIIFSVIVLLVFLAGVTFFGGRAYGYGGMMGPGMMGGWGFGPFGFLGMMFMWLIPVGLAVLTVLGVIWLVRSLSGSSTPQTPARSCPNCSRPVQADWSTCPYCGQSLT